MTKRFMLILAALFFIFLLQADSALAQTGAGTQAFEQYCATCHGNPSSAVAAPEELKLRRLTGDEIYAALSKGPHISLQGITDDEKREIALTIGGRKPGVTQIADAKSMTKPLLEQSSAW